MRPPDPRSVIATVLLALLLLLAAVAAAGCSSARRQHAADAVAGIDALAGLAPSSTASSIAAAARKLAAAAADAREGDLPAPMMRPDEIVARPNDYAPVGRAAEEGVGAGLWAGVAAVAAVAAGLAVRLGAGGPLATLLSWALESAPMRRRREDLLSRSDALKTIVQVIERSTDLDVEAVRSIKKRISKATRLTPGASAALEAILATIEEPTDGTHLPAAQHVDPPGS